MSEDDSPSAAIARLIDEWREEADRFDASAAGLLSNRAGTAVAHEKQRIAAAYRRCANELDAALRACAEARPSTENVGEEDDQSRGGNQADRDRLQSSAPTDGGITTSAPNRQFQSCHCPAAHGEDCPLTTDECEARTRDYVGLPWFGARLRRIWEGFLSESLNGVVCSIPDSGLNTPAHRHWCLRCQRRYMELKALVDMLDSPSAPPRAEALAPHPQTTEDKADTRGGSQ